MHAKSVHGCVPDILETSHLLIQSAVREIVDSRPTAAIYSDFPVVQQVVVSLPPRQAEVCAQCLALRNVLCFPILLASLFMVVASPIRGLARQLAYRRLATSISGPPLLCRDSGTCSAHVNRW